MKKIELYVDEDIRQICKTEQVYSLSVYKHKRLYSDTLVYVYTDVALYTIDQHLLTP